MKPKIKKSSNKVVKKDVKKDQQDTNPNPLENLKMNHIYGIGFALFLFLVIFGKIIAISASLCAVGHVTGKILKRIDKRRVS